jgi:hypothetical protein
MGEVSFQENAGFARTAWGINHVKLVLLFDIIKHQEMLLFQLKQ